MKAYIKENYVVLFIYSLMLFLVACSSDNKFKFAFNRKDGETYVQKLSINKKSHTDSDYIETEETLTETKVTCKKIKEGWDIESQPLKTIMMKDGKEVKSPIFTLLKQFVITYRLDNNGLLTDVLGYDKIVEAVKLQYPPEVAEILSAKLNIDNMRQRESSEWKGRIGDFLSKEFSIGDTWAHDTSYTLPNGVKINYRVKTHFKEMVQQDGVTCVVIEQTYDSAGKGADDPARDTSKKDAVGRDDTGEGESNSSIKGGVTRIIDPATMRIYKEEVKRIIHMDKEMPVSGKIPMEIVETRTYEYEYGR